MWVSEIQTRDSKKTWRGYKLNRQKGVKKSGKEVGKDRQKGGVKWQAKGRIKTGKERRKKTGNGD
jgi:hypothetical protein